MGHEVRLSKEMEWSELENGALIAAAEPRFDAFVTTDKNLRYQQNLTGRHLAILVLPTTRWPRIRRHVGVVVEAVDRLKPGDFINLVFPD